MRRPSHYLYLSCGLVLAAACNGVIGIDDLHEGPRPGTEEAGGSAGTKNNSNGGSDITPEGGDGVGGTSDGSAGKNNGGTSGESTGGKQGTGGTTAIHEGGAGADAGGEGGGGGGEPQPGPVHGHVIDFWGHDVAGIPVQIGDTLTSTNANGEFTIADVPATYDVSLVFDHPALEGQTDAWAYLGLTRRDPTLQIFIGGESRSGKLSVTFSPKPTVMANQRLWAVVGGADGAQVYDDIDGDGYPSTYSDWYGPASTNETGHGLLWQTDGSKLPTSYIGYDSKLFALTEGGPAADLILNVSAKSQIDSANIQGTVTPANFSTRNNLMFLRFTSRATVGLVSYAGPTPNAFSYLAPSIPNSSLTVAAVEGSAFKGLAIAHADGLAPGAKPSLKVPVPAKPLTPAGGAKNVGPTTKFSFQPGADNPGPFVLTFYSQDNAANPNANYQAIFIVTAKPELTLPSFIGGGFTLYAENEYLWTVQTHGTFSSVDAMLGPSGFLDEFSWDERTAIGPLRGSGTFTDTTPRRFTTAP